MQQRHNTTPLLFQIENWGKKGVTSKTVVLESSAMFLDAPVLHNANQTVVIKYTFAISIPFLFLCLTVCSKLTVKILLHYNHCNNSNC